MATRRRAPARSSTRVFNRIIPIEFPQVEQRHVNNGLILLGLGLVVWWMIQRQRENSGATMPIGYDIGRGAVSAAGDVASGAVIGAGEIFGIPATNTAQCEAAKAAGNTWDASFYCPATEFISWWVNK